MQSAKITLTLPQAKALLANKTVQLKKEQLVDGQHAIALHPLNHKKLLKAATLNKGFRLTLSDPELAESGEGFRDIFRNVVNAGKWIGTKINNVIASPIYQSDIKPLVRKAVDAAVIAATPMLGAAAPTVADLVNKAGTATNAFGLAAKKRVVKNSQVNSLKPKATPKPKAKKSTLGTASGSFLIN